MKKYLLSFLLAINFFSSCNRNQKQTSEADEINEVSAILKISAASDPTGLDPRSVRDLPTVTALRMFFEGLMRADGKGSLVPANAKSYTISPDGKTYTFTLRQSSWSNGKPVTAHDYEYSWKSVLDPDFAAQNAYQFYMIKGAKEAKEGKIGLDEVSIHAKDDHTLVVELNEPTPYFLELTAFHPFFPVNKEWALNTSHEKYSPQQFVSNGPFKLEKWGHQNVIVANKNRHYWNAGSISLDQIQILTLDENTALQMFESNSLDWTGSPLSTLPPDSINTLKKENQLGIAPAAGTHIFRLNTERVPFNNKKIRKAFAYALDRQQIAEHILQGGQLPATALVPPYMGLGNENLFKDHDITIAQKLFEEGLQELNLTRETLPKIAFSYTQGDRNHKIAQAVQQQWNNAFGINVVLESSEGKVLYQNLANKNYQIANGNWFADINDPINFLEVFKSKNNSTNNTQWENKKYAQLLDESALVANQPNRKQILQEAEKILIEQMPIIPLFYYTFNFVKKEQIQGVYFSDLGYLDFSRALIDYDILDTMDESE